MSAPLTASARTVGQLIASTRFEIPAYQREYAWRDGEVREFWTDLRDALDRSNTYFLGLFILTGEQPVKQVVDGQQRLLTVTLLAAALRQEALVSGRRALAENIESTLLRSMSYETDESLRRVQLTDPEGDITLESLVDESEPRHIGDLDVDSSSTRLRFAYWFLRDKIRAERDSADAPSDFFRLLGAWARFLHERLYVAVFEHPDESSAYSVFEVVNTRGRQLTTADLLKNYVLRETSQDLRHSVHASWLALTAAFEEIDESGSFVSFIRHVVMLDAGGYVLPKALYDYIAARGDYSRRDPVDPLRLLETLTAHLPLYLQLVDPTADGPSPIEQLGIFVALNELGVTAVRPLLLAIAETPEATQGMRAVLKVVVKRVVVGNLGAGSLERRFADAATAVRDSGDWRDGVRELTELDHTRGEFENALRTRPYNRNTLVFLRRSIVQQSMVPESEGTLQLVRPRRVSEAEWPGFNDEEAAYWSSRLANTLLVDLDRRPRGANTWTGFKESLLPKAVKGEPALQMARLRHWTAATAARTASELARAAADVWC